jgi:DNA mismatch repair protein MutS
MGDFYEMFYEDAVTAAKALEIALTSRSKDKDGTPVPDVRSALSRGIGYIARLVRQGFRVALCEQMEDPAHGEGRRQARRSCASSRPPRSSSRRRSPPPRPLS